MTDIGILFSGPMVRALLARKKSQTRRLAWRDEKMSPEMREQMEHFGKPTRAPTIWQKVKAGDRLWVRETFVLEDNREYRGDAPLPTDGRPIRTVDGGHDWGEYDLIPHYRATEPEPHIVPYDLLDGDDDRTRWRSPIHMPKWASRLTLVVTETRLQRLQEISEEDAIAEGVEWFPFPGTPDGESLHWWYSFSLTWDSLHKPGTRWADDPTVVAISFKVHQCNIEEMTA